MVMAIICLDEVKNALRNRFLWNRCMTQRDLSANIRSNYLAQQRRDELALAIFLLGLFFGV
jgi:hypothetical protein